MKGLVKATARHEPTTRTDSRGAPSESVAKDERGEVPDWRQPAALGYAIILITFFGLGGWSALAKIDSAVAAPCVVINDANKRTVQHLEGGIVREVLAHEGQHVEHGQVLFRIDPVQAKASYDLQRNQLDFGLAQEARLQAEI